MSALLDDERLLMDPERHLPEEAIAVETYVEPHRGQWQVSVVVVFADEVVRRIISSYHTERMATVAASWIKRAAQRDFAGARPAVPQEPLDRPDDLQGRDDA